MHTSLQEICAFCDPRTLGFLHRCEQTRSLHRKDKDQYDFLRTSSEYTLFCATVVVLNVLRFAHPMNMAENAAEKVSQKAAEKETERDLHFAKIKEYFDYKDKELARKGKLPLGATELGFWGTAHLDDIYEWCKRISLQEERGLLDLGSGDGRVIFVTSLFTHSVGVEYDAKLHAQAEEAKLALAARGVPVVHAHFLQSDYTVLDLSPYPVWFSYADHNFGWLEKKQHELTKLYLYHDTFHPHFLKKQKITWVGQIPIFLYTREELSDDSIE